MLVAGLNKFASTVMAPHFLGNKSAPRTTANTAMFVTCINPLAPSGDMARYAFEDSTCMILVTNPAGITECKLISTAISSGVIDYLHCAFQISITFLST